MLNFDADITDKKLINHYFEIKDYENLLHIALCSSMEFEGYTKDLDQCRIIFEKLYEVKYLPVFSVLAELYRNENDINKSLKVLKEGANENCLKCLRYLGEAYYEGYNVEKNLNKALEYFEKAAILDDQFSIKFISVAYLYDYYPYKGLKSLNIFNKGKDLNFKDSLLCLAKIHENPQGIKFDLGLALALKNKCLNEDNIDEVKKLALEPIAEVMADKNSYGFRPKRSTQDAMKQVWLCTSKRNGGEWILEADIKGCFDNISHQWIYDNIPLDNRLLKQWLKSGFIKDDTLFPTESGTPQGGIISPILANMVLDGIEDIVKSHKARFQKMKDGVILYRYSNRLNFIRYADDFVITGYSPEYLRLVQNVETHGLGHPNA